MLEKTDVWGFFPLQVVTRLNKMIKRENVGPLFAPQPDVPWWQKVIWVVEDDLERKIQLSFNPRYTLDIRDLHERFWIESYSTVKQWRVTFNQSTQ